MEIILTLFSASFVSVIVVSFFSAILLAAFAVLMLMSMLLQWIVILYRYKAQGEVKELPANYVLFITLLCSLFYGFTSYYLCLVYFDFSNKIAFWSSMGTTLIFTVVYLITILDVEKLYILQGDIK